MLARPSFYFACLIFLMLSGAKQEDGINWGSSVEGCRLSLSADKTQYHAGEPVNLRVVLQNQDRNELRTFQGEFFPYRVEIYLPNNDEAPLTLWGRMVTRTREQASNVGIILPRGESHADDLIALNRMYDMTLDGKYVIFVHRTLPSESDPHAWTSVDSNPVVVEIKNP
jgi:hypothetical protein